MHVEPASADEKIIARVWLDPKDFNVYSVEMVLSYDTSKTSFISVDKGSVVNEWLLASNLNYPGRVCLALAGAIPAAEAGTILSLNFQLLSSDQNINLMPIKCEVNEISVPITIIRPYMLNIFALTGLPSPGKGGTTEPSPGSNSYFSRDSVPIKARPKTDYRFSKWTGDVSDPDIYKDEISILMDKSKSITANFCTKCGDVNGDLNITPGDAQVAFEIYLGKVANPTEYQKENADVNCDGAKKEPKVTPQDAQAIFEKYLGRSELPSDCSGKSRSEVVSVQGGVISDVNLIINDIEVSRGEEVVLPVIIDNPFGIDAFGFDLIFPSDILEFVGVERTELLKGFNQVEGNEIRKGVLRVGGYGSEPIKSRSSAVLITLIFKVVSEPKKPSNLAIINRDDDLKNAAVRNGMIVAKKDINKEKKKRL
jgi:hypothetical protein